MALVPQSDAPADAQPSAQPAARTLRRHAARQRAVAVAVLTKTPIPEVRSVGRPGHVVTPTQKRLVQHWTAVGLSQAKIAALMGIADVTLQKHYRYELDHGEEIANANVAANLYRIACGATPAAAGAAQYWLNRRSDAFREGAKRVELTGKNGAPVAVASAQLTIDARRLTVDQRDALREILMAASDAAPDSEEPDTDGVDAASLTADDWPGDDADARRSVDDPTGEDHTSGFDP